MGGLICMWIGEWGCLVHLISYRLVWEYLCTHWKICLYLSTYACVTLPFLINHNFLLGLNLRATRFILHKTFSNNKQSNQASWINLGGICWSYLLCWSCHNLFVLINFQWFFPACKMMQILVGLSHDILSGERLWKYDSNMKVSKYRSAK